MSRLENTWLSAHRLHCEEKRRSCQCSAFAEPIHVIKIVDLHKTPSFIKYKIERFVLL